jgi:hypothetical protein
VIVWRGMKNVRFKGCHVVHEVPAPQGCLPMDAEKGLTTIPIPDRLASFLAVTALAAGNKILSDGQTTVDLSNNVIESGTIANGITAISAFPIPGFKNRSSESLAALTFVDQFSLIDPMNFNSHKLKSASQV